MKNLNQKTEYALILHNIRSAQNVGALFRTADAVGITKIYLTGYTPTPLDKFGRDRSDVAKSALGAEHSVLWEHRMDITAVIDMLKQDKHTIVAIEQSKNAVDYKKIKKTTRMAFILGNEVEGIENEVLKLCDKVAEIPMSGKKESLNVSVAGGVALFRILDK